MRKIWIAGMAALLTLSACGGSDRDRDRERDRDRRDRDRGESSERDDRRSRNESANSDRDERENSSVEEQEADTAASSSDTALATSVRRQIASACEQNAASELANVPGLDAERLCECVADRATKGRSADELQTILSGGSDAKAMGEEVGRQCAMEQMGGGR